MQSRFKDWGDARVFLAVVREGSTLAAARVLGINQTTVARRMDVLEHSLGLKLFDKTTRGACPTENATQLVPLAEAVEAAALALEDAAIAVQSRYAKPIRITAFDHEIFGNIGAIAADFTDQNPHITFEFVASELLLDLSKGEADIALRVSPAIKDDTLIANHIGATAWTYYASKEYARRNGTPDDFSDPMVNHTVAILRHVASHRRNLMRCNSANDVMLAINSGQAIGPFPVFVGDTNPNLVRCFDPPEHAHMKVWLLASEAAFKRPEVRAFTAFATPRLRQTFKGNTDQ